MSSRNVRNSYRIACRAGQQGARPSVSGQAEVEKLSTDLPSKPAVAANPSKGLPNRVLPHQNGQVPTQIEDTPWTREDYIEVMLGYYKAKADPSEGVTKNKL